MLEGNRIIDNIILVMNSVYEKHPNGISSPLAQEYLYEIYELGMFDGRGYNVCPYIGSGQLNPYESIDDYVGIHDELDMYLDNDIRGLFGLSLTEYMNTTRYEREIMLTAGLKHTKRKNTILKELREE